MSKTKNGRSASPSTSHCPHFGTLGKNVSNLTFYSRFPPRCWVCAKQNEGIDIAEKRQPKDINETRFYNGNRQRTSVLSFNRPDVVNTNTMTDYEWMNLCVIAYTRGVLAGLQSCFATSKPTEHRVCGARNQCLCMVPIVDVGYV